MKIHFTVPGFSKCGTTSLCRMLGQHRDLFLPEVRKEPNYFSYRAEKGWDWYESLFESAKKTQLCGEGSTPYSSRRYAKVACEGLLEHNPDMKFIFIARNPIKRLESSFRQIHNSGHIFGVVPQFEIGECLRSRAKMIADTRYWKLINIYRKRVPDHQIHVLFQEHLKSDPVRELTRCFEFLGVEPNVDGIQLHQKLNSSADKLQDTPFYRWLNSRPMRQRILWKLGLKPGSVLTKKIGLRVPGQHVISWKAKDRQWVLDQLLEDSLSFLDHYGEPRSLWGLDDRSLSERQSKAA